MHEHIWRSFDIRGVAFQEITVPFATQFGLACAAYFRRRNAVQIAVGRDSRSSGPVLEDALIQGLRQGGMQVFSLGVAPTPAVYFASSGYGFDAAVIVTASHNPPAYNGFKIRLHHGPLHSDDFKEIRRDFETAKPTSLGSFEQIDLKDTYLNTIAALTPLPPNTTIAVDAGNGATSEWAPELFARLGATVVPLYCTPDGSFPNHPADPTKKKNLLDLQTVVLEEQADLGVAFDGDGDRVGIVLPTGKMLWGDELISILGQDLLRWKTSSVVCDVKCSLSLHDIVQQMGSKTIVSPTGYPNIQQRMQLHGAILGGEQSSHICIRDQYYCYDDGLFAAAKLAHLGARLLEYESNIPRYPCTPEIRIPLSATQRSLVQATPLPQLNDCRRTTLDGVRFEDEQGWMLFRLSGTENQAILRVEARTAADFERWRIRAATILEHYALPTTWLDQS